MSRSTKAVTTEDRSRLPDWLSVGVTLVADLERRGMLEQVRDKLKIRREGGYSGSDLFALLLFLFSAGPGMGIKTFCRRIGRFNAQLAALVGRTRLPSQASASRALEAVELGSVRPLHRWLLMDVAGVEAVMRHPSTKTRDANGEAWDVFDLDGTVHVLRHRALPDREGYPDANRRSESIAAPGYPGRKRGDTQIMRCALQHAGSGMWLFGALSPGNGKPHPDLEEALQVIEETCHRLGRPLNRAMLRMDGAYGWVPYLTACREHGIAFVTRLTRPELFDQRNIRERLATARWELIPDSASGPRRSAADLGVVTVHPGPKTQDQDGEEYDPISVRVVVSRFERDEAQRGRVIDGWQYELFAIDLPAEAFPAPEAIAKYFGRSSEENCFGQEDRELQLDRIFSYTLAGQELAVLIGLMVWNLKIARGVELKPPTEPLPEQEVRKVEPDPRPVPPPPAPVDQEEVAPPSEVETELRALLDGLDWTALLAKRPGWHWRSDPGQIECPDGKLLWPSFVNYKATGEPRLYFSGQEGACDGCPLRADCFKSTRRRAAKLINVAVPDRVMAGRLAELLDLHPFKGRPRSGSKRAEMPLAVPDNLEPGPFKVTGALFLPAAARQRLVATAERLTAYVDVKLPGPPPPRDALVARTPEERRHGRLTWAMHHARYALPEAADVRVTYAAPPELHKLLGVEVSAAAA